jgi:putative ABC transport system permease protein
MFRLALRNALRHRGRSALLVTAIALGVAGLILAGGFIEDVFVQLAEATIHGQLGHVQVARSGYFDRRAGASSDFLITKPDRLVHSLAAVPDVDDVLTRLTFSGLLGNGKSELSIVGEAVEPAKEARLGTYVTIVAGRRLSNDDRFGMLVGEGVASALRVEPGDAVTLVVQTPEGAMNTSDFVISGVFRTFSRDYDARAVRINHAASEQLLGVDGATSIVLLLRDTAQTDRAAREASGIAGEGYDTRTWRQLSDFYVKTRALYEREFLVLQVIILGLIALSVMNSVNMSLAERIGEFGTMRALGDRGLDVFRLILLECALLGFAGALVGVLLGVCAAVVLSAIGIPMPPPPNANSGYLAQIRIVPTFIAIAAAVAVVSTLLASLAPARRAARIDVVEALRQSV